MKKTELEHFKNILEQRKQEIIDNINDSTKQIDELRQNEFDVASISTDSDLEYSISSKQKIELNAINESLRKIANGTYGICEMCDENISIARLKAKPNVKLCITCQEISEKNNN